MFKTILLMMALTLQMLIPITSWCSRCNINPGRALNTITAAQAKLGSTQNRLQHNIDNLTALSSQTEISRGRITDADYAAETSQLSKQQILSQAATSMLAQANQSKQGVLALLQ